MLTEHDRKYLMGEAEYEDSNSESQKRHQIRRKIINGVIDFNYLMELSDGDVDTVFDKFDDMTEEGMAFNSGAITALRFIYEGLGREKFETLTGWQIKRDIQQMYADQGEWAPVDVRIVSDIGETTPIDRKVEQVTGGAEVTQDFLNVLTYLERKEPEMHEKHPDL